MTLVLAGGVSRADDFTPAELVLMKLFGSDPITPEMFTANFLAQVSMPQILSVFAKTRATVGPPVSIEEAGNSYIVHTATYRIPVDIGLDPDGRVAALLLHPAVPTFATIDDVFKAIDALKGQAAYLITRNGEVLHAKSQTLPLAVSSGVKLAVLAAVADEIAAGRLAWDTVVRLGPNDISLAPGVLQTMPPGSPLTVHTLAAFMISQSDGTATDALLNLVGRDKVAREAGADFVLKTSEFFKLKADPALRLRFTGADTIAEKLKVAADMAKMPLPNPADTGAPLDAGVEWYMPATRLCELIGKVAGLDVFVMNPGVARPNDWAQIAFKGGSEVGVASLTSALTDKSGNRYCVAMTLNDRTALDEDRLTSLYGALIDKLAGR